VARSARGDVAIVYGEPHRWAPAVVEQRDGRGEVVHTWTFDHGLVGAPRWSADGTRLLAVETEPGAPPRLLSLSAADGGTEKLGGETAAAALPDGLAIARGGKLVRRRADGEVVLADHAHGAVRAPRASPDGAQIAYAVVERRSMDLWVAAADGGGERLLFSAPPSRAALHWSPDSSYVYAVLAGDWDWQVWELAVDGRAPRALIREAAAIADLAVAPGGERLAVVAVAELGLAAPRREVFVIDRRSGQAARHNLSGHDAHGVAWLDEQSLLVVASDPTYEVVPEHRELRKLLLGDGSLVEYP
jgi:Tol biopolymer transport system component